MYFFNREELSDRAKNLHEQWKSNSPFPHVVIDDFLPEDVAKRIGENFPKIEEIPWRLVGPGDSINTEDPDVEKISCADEQQFPVEIRQLIHSIQSGVFLRFLEELTGFEHLAADPHNFGGGLHSTGAGGRLMVHVDASRHPNKDFQQVANLIYYCTPDWKDEYNGHLELWTRTPKECAKKILPKFNRAVLFYTGKDSLHGQPNPVTAPSGIRRNSIALYFYSTRTYQSDLEYTNFVQWHKTTPYDRKTIKHRLKSIIRNTLPSALTNRIALIVRKIR